MNTRPFKVIIFENTIPLRFCSALIMTCIHFWKSIQIRQLWV